MDLEVVLNRLYESEINCSITSFWDAGWNVKLGDERNGFVAEDTFKTLEEAAVFLDHRTRIHFPESLYALGRTEHGKRVAIRLEAEREK